MNFSVSLILGLENLRPYCSFIFIVTFNFLFIFKFYFVVTSYLYVYIFIVHFFVVSFLREKRGAIQEKLHS